MRLRWRVATGFGVAALASVALLAGEVLYTTQRTFLGADDAPPVGGVYGRPAAQVLRLVVLGDSTAAGVGASATATTVGGRLAELLAERTGRRVELTSVAVSGARSADLDTQAVAAVAGVRPDLAVVLIGANDSTHVTSTGAVRRDVASGVGRLTAAGVGVVVGTCPDMGAARALPRPLRDLTAWRGRSVADATASAVRGAGARAVDLAALTGPAFRADPAMLSGDEFHPSDRGYALWADVLAPALLELATGR